MTGGGGESKFLRARVELTFPHKGGNSIKLILLDDIRNDKRVIMKNL